MPELLLEVGCEELPASSVRRACSDLLNNVTSLLREAGVLESEGSSMGTPRRLVVTFPDLKARQEDASKEVRGPGIKAAFDAGGQPTQALLGFCRSQGVTPETLRKDDTYVYAIRHIPGKQTDEILAEVLPKAIRAMTFDKTMRWGSSRMRFARPIRWLLAAFDGQPVNFEIEGVASGLVSYGHRFYAPEPFEARTFRDLLDGLRERKVELDPEVRRQRIVDEAAKVAGGVPDLSDGLVEENVYLTEWPTAIQGTFGEGFMSLPEAVLVTAMAKHERMFPVRDENGKLTNRFVFIRNSGEDDSVRAGSEWVLNARFNDAKFFFDEDSKHPLSYFLEKTEGIAFQDKLGSVRRRADRLADLCEHIAQQTGARGREIEFARTAGLYAKADLSTGLVSELASLQGIVGGAYARRDGIFGSIAWAIETQYDIAKNTDPGDCSGERASLRLAMADQLDKLAGYLGIGHEPKGSSDPYGLRRAATILIEAAWRWHEPLPNYAGFFEKALDGYEAQGFQLDRVAAQKAFLSLFASRYGSMMPDIRHDLLEAAIVDPLGIDVALPRSVKLRTECLKTLGTDTSFVQTARRPLNILAFAKRDNHAFATDRPLESISREHLDSPEGSDLMDTLIEQEEELSQCLLAEDAEGVVGCIQRLSGPINRFFDNTMVMAERSDVRFARLTLMYATSLQLLAAGDFSKVVIEG